jgi:hypothetical protein
MKTYTWNADSGHAWLAVKSVEIKALGLLDKISSYSYISKSGKTIYLEEDCDATLFINKKVELNQDINPDGRLNTDEKYKDGQSHIRGLESFSELQLAVNEKYHR